MVRSANSTQPLDRIETQALSEVFGGSRTMVTSIKGAIGECGVERGSGGCGGTMRVRQCRSADRRTELAGSASASEPGYGVSERPRRGSSTRCERRRALQRRPARRSGFGQTLTVGASFQPSARVGTAVRPTVELELSLPPWPSQNSPTCMRSFQPSLLQSSEHHSSHRPQRQHFRSMLSPGRSRSRRIRYLKFHRRQSAARCIAAVTALPTGGTSRRMDAATRPSRIGVAHR